MSASTVIGAPTPLPPPTTGPSGASVAGETAKAFPEPLISLQMFKDWSKACRVRQLQNKYDELLEKAADENLSLEQYMKANNLDNQNRFLLSIPQFPLTCWPVKLSELGSGIVLYFHFLVFLGCFLFLSFLVQIPAVIEYWDKDNFDMWLSKAPLQRNDTEMLDKMFIYTSPGLLGPRMGDSENVPMCYFALVAFLCGAVVAKSAWQIRVDNLVDGATTQPNDFAIMVTGLPPGATDEEAIVNFFKEHAIRGSTDTEVVKVVIGWDAGEYRAKMRLLKELKEVLDELPPDDGRAITIQEQMQQIKTALHSAAPDNAAKLKSSGVVVVSFRYQTDLRRCLDRWQSLWATFAYRDWGAWRGLCGGAPLPRFPTATGIGVWKIKVQRAPNPGDINWDDLGTPRGERFKMLAKTNAAMVLIIVASFFFSLLMIHLKEGSNNQWLSILPALGIAGANAGMSVAAKKFGSREYHNTVTGQNASITLKMTVAMIVNTGLIMLVINRKVWEWYKKAGLVSDMLMLVGVEACIQPAIQWFDIKYYIFGTKKRWGLKNADIDRLRNGAQWYNDNGVPVPADEEYTSFKKEYQRTVKYFKSAYEPSEMDMKRRYAFATRTFVCCMCYCHLIPFVSLVGIAGITVQYWVDKSLLLRWYKRSEIPQGKTQPAISLVFLRFTTLLMPLCMWFFIEPSYKSKDGNKLLYWMALSYAPAVFICFLPLKMIRHVLCAPCRGRNRARVASDEREDYYTAQYLWPANFKYHKSHDLYRGLPPSKNPEFLDENTYAFTRADDVKASYGASLTRASSAAASGPDSAVDVEPPATGPAATGVILGSGADAPAAAPAVTAGSDAPAIVTASVEPTLLPGKPDAGKGGDGGGGYRGGGKSGAVWEMEVGRGWSKFANDCQGYIEDKYQSYTNGFPAKGNPTFKVKTQDMILLIDFEKMTQKRIKPPQRDKNKEYNIRRKDGT